MGLGAFEVIKQQLTSLFIEQEDSFESSLQFIASERYWHVREAHERRCAHVHASTEFYW